MKRPMGIRFRNRPVDPFKTCCKNHTNCRPIFIQVYCSWCYNLEGFLNEGEQDYKCSFDMPQFTGDRPAGNANRNCPYSAVCYWDYDKLMQARADSKS